ncbi:Serine/threonine protein kinase [Sandaracinus amylolyticus]|uniref:Serine/threonine protein kinase n=1 Tax=Sandaracinus amylolyticus TaxID=927083 RepID=A0A0F6YIB4_9BACT|nr:Serine/threonine protein kinase [Sandaracinus amylolyticus]
MSGVAQTERPPPMGAPEESSHVGFRSEAWLGRLVEGRYRVAELLGEGGMGAVFLAEHVKLSKKVALKVILPQFAGDGELAERFAREAMASAKLDHPHVASALDYGALPEGGAYLVMPYVRGRSLRRAMDAGDATWQFACDIGAQIADALAAAHAHRIVHRDLKPENVILEPRDDGSEMVKVLDFGVARVASEEGATASTGKALTRVGTIIGTPGYMAPEQALGENVDTRADLYALGVVLWELVAKQPLFPDDDLTAIVTRQLTTDIPRLASLVPDVPVELDELVARLLARARDDRPQRAGEVRDVLRRLALGAALEHKVLSGEIAVPIRSSDTSGQHPVVDTTGSIATAQPSVVLPAGLGKAAETLQGTMNVGPVRNVPTSLVVAGCATPLVLAMLMFVGVLAFGGGEETPAGATVATTTPEAQEAPPTPPARETGRRGAPERELPRAPDPPDDQAAAAPVSDTSGVPIPIEIARDVSTLLDSGSGEEREDAARRIRDAARTDAPPFVAAVVALELGERCPDRRTAVRDLGRIGDARALPALERLHRDRRGCGFLNTQDCHRCLRRDLRDARRALSGTAAEE